MLNGLLVALMSGLPAALVEDDLDRLADGVSSELLAPALDARVRQIAHRPELAVDAMDLLAPLAERVGLATHRARLEDESFRTLDPDGYSALLDALPSRATDARDLEALMTQLAASFPEAEVTGRLKSLWSLQKKALRKDIPPDEVWDRIALRLVLPDEDGCYDTLGALLAQHAAVPGELDDYIRAPKASGYQALHAALRFDLGGRDVVAEVQLKTPAMHHAAEQGPAAHWRYKA